MKYIALACLCCCLLYAVPVVGDQKHSISDRKPLTAWIEALNSKDAKTREAAADHIGKIGPNAKAAIPALLKTLKDDEFAVRFSAAEALGRIGPAAVSPLIGILQKAKPRQRNGKPERLQPLARKPDWYEGCARECAAKALGIIGAQAKAAIPTQIITLLDEDPGVRGQAVCALRKIGPVTKEVVPALIEAMKDDDELVGIFAADSLATFGPEAKSAVPALAEMLKDRDSGVRGRAALALRGIGPSAKQTVPALVALLRDRDSSARLAAAMTLGKLGQGSREAVQALTQSLRDENQLVWDAAAQALKQIQRNPPNDTGAKASERDRTFTWFGTLGYPDVKDSAFVRVTTVDTSPFGAGQLHEFGFLLKGGKTFTVLTLGLEVKAYKQSPPETPPQSRVGYEKMNLSTLADRYLKTWPNAVERGELDGLQDKLWYVHLKGLTGAALSREERIQHHLNTSLSEPTEVFIAAWACQRQGLAALAERLYERARSIPRDPQRTSAKSLQELVAEELSWAEIWRTALAFEDVVLSWAQLRQRCERIIRICPENSCVPEVRERIKILDRMIREDEEHVRRRKNAPAFERLSKAEQTAELIFRLRNQTGQWVFSTRDSEEMRDSPAHQLVKRGYEVIPALVEALGDKSFTRSIGFHGARSGPTEICDFFCRHMLTVGECAEYVIERIAGRYFEAPGQKYGDTAALKPVIRAWYAELQRKGEKRMLIEGVERGDRNSPSQGALLLERYPRDALPALIKGARVPRDYPPIRVELVSLIGRVTGDEPLGFLLKEIKKGPYVISRVAAARGLLARKHREGVDAMIAEWNAGLPVVDSSDNLWADKSIYAMTEIARFLADSGSVNAINALGKKLRQRPVGLRVEVIAAFLDEESKATWGLGNGGGETHKQTAPVREAVERLLVFALDDQDQRNVSGMWMGKDILSPRVCDYAGHVLNEIDPARYGFDLAAPLAERNRRRVELKNAWRMVRHQQPLSVPPPRIVPPVPEEKLEPLLSKLLRDSSQEQKEVRNGIESLGLGALPGVLRRLEKTPNAGHETLEQIGRRLACIVDRLEFAEESLKPDPAFGARLQSLKGRSLDPATFIQTVAGIAKSPPKDVYGIVFCAYRGADGRGVTVNVDLVNRARAALLLPAFANSSESAPERPKSWEFNEYVKISRKGIHDVSGATNTLVWDGCGLSGVLAEACAAPPLTPFEMSVQLLGRCR